MTTELQRAYEFGPFRLDPEKRLLLCQRRPVPLTPKAFDILQLLVENSGRVVSKEELMSAIWPNAFVTDANLTQTVFMLRKALADSAGDFHYIATVSGRGYRFDAPVQPVADTSPAPFSSVPPEEPPPPGASLRRSRPWLWLLAGAVALAVVLAGLASVRRFRLRASTRTAPPKLIVAVLPFENLTGDPQQELFIDGLTAETIVQLQRVDPDHLAVIARGSVMEYRKGFEQFQRMARQLNIDYALEGSVRRDGDNLRITAELIRTRDQTHVWARNYDRRLSGMLALQGEIANEVADEVQLALGENKLTRAKLPSPPPQARDLYIKGRYFWNKRTARGFSEALEFFQKAIAADPNYAPAYSGLADCYSLLSSYSYGPPAGLVAKARAAALRALQIDPDSAPAHTSLALIAENYDWDWQTAEKEYRRALQLDPNYVTAHHWYAELLTWQGRFDEAFAESARARALDPLSLIIATDDAAIRIFAGQYDRAIEELQAVLEMEPDFPRAHGILIEAYVQQGRFAEALEQIKVLRRFQHSPYPWVWAQLAYIYGRRGSQAQAQYAISQLKKETAGTTFSATAPLAVAYAGVGRKDEALECLEQAYKERSNALTGIKVDHVYDSIRDDPRFQTLLQRVGLGR
jgi:TolB-like protein/DNA-binding winged helix-turn-helix (wHTH) protein/Flp pilus assembly protein TadD